VSAQIVTTGNVDQSNNTVKGHMAARDVNVTNVEAAPQIESSLSRLYRKLKAEAGEDPKLVKYINQLEIFTRIVDDEEVIGLDGKLTNAGRLDQLNMAMAMKEQTYDQLRTMIFSKTFQTIYATLMAKIFEEFQTYVIPAIHKGAEREIIDQLVSQQVVKPIVAELEACPDYEGVAINDVRGMLYFLTGNCHLVWS
jgi:hypothetical protein